MLIAYDFEILCRLIQKEMSLKLETKITRTTFQFWPSPPPMEPIKGDRAN